MIGLPLPRGGILKIRFRSDFGEERPNSLNWFHVYCDEHKVMTLFLNPTGEAARGVIDSSIRSVVPSAVIAKIYFENKRKPLRPDLRKTGRNTDSYSNWRNEVSIDYEYLDRLFGERRPHLAFGWGAGVPDFRLRVLTEGGSRKPRIDILETVCVNCGAAGVYFNEPVPVGTLLKLNLWDYTEYHAVTGVNEYGEIRTHPLPKQWIEKYWKQVRANGIPNKTLWKQWGKVWGRKKFWARDSLGRCSVARNSYTENQRKAAQPNKTQPSNAGNEHREGEPA